MVIIIIREVIPDLHFNVTKLGIPFPTPSFNDNEDVNKNSKKGISLDWQNKTLQTQHAFLYISLPSLHDYDVKIPNFTLFLWRM